MLSRKSQFNQVANQKIWLDKGSEFYNRSMKSWLQDNNIGMYSTKENKGISDKGK